LEDLFVFCFFGGARAAARKSLRPPAPLLLLVFVSFFCQFCTFAISLPLRRARAHTVVARQHPAPLPFLLFVFGVVDGGGRRRRPPDNASDPPPSFFPRALQSDAPGAT
jgi:hypothetical protein